MHTNRNKNFEKERLCFILIFTKMSKCRLRWAWSPSAPLKNIIVNRKRSYERRKKKWEKKIRKGMSELYLFKDLTTNKTNWRHHICMLDQS